jgi:hypothetical protein
VKQASDIIQILLTDLGPFSALVALALAWLILQAGRIIQVLFGAILAGVKAARFVLVNPFNARTGIAVLFIAATLYLNAGRVSDVLQYVEQAVICPTYADTAHSYYVECLYEDQIKKHTNEAQFLTVRDSTRALAKEIGCTPADIYLVAYSECGLNPFTIRTDGIAAGWIQFTKAGVQNLGVSLEQVKRYCREGNAERIMALTGAYIRLAAKGRPIKSATDFYTAVFAPGKLGAGMDDVLYQGFANPEYYLNAGLDGYFVESGKVLYLPHRKDGKLTKRDLYASLMYKDARFKNM